MLRLIRRLNAAALALTAAVGCGSLDNPERISGRAAEPAPSAETVGVVQAPVELSAGRGSTFLVPNAWDVDGTPGYVHVTPSEMPLVVSIGFPLVAPRFGTRRDARRVAIEAMREWEQGIRTVVPWFLLEFVEQDETAVVQVTWKRRMTGSAAARGGVRYWVDSGRLRVGGMMEISTTPAGHQGLEYRTRVDELRRIVAHEFGHVLGLMHCLNCDSVMNYSWDTLDEVVVTALDVRTFAALVERPNGHRVDREPFSFLPEGALHEGGRAEP